MAELVTMALFCAALIACIITNISIVPALLAGVVMFLIHGKITGHKFATMLSKGFATMRAASIVVVTFVLIGLLTTLWRAAGTVPFIVANTSSLVRPHVVILLAFLLNCLMSLLTGSSFATAATMGVITMTLGTSMQVSPVFLGGAILSGVYFGDRCSPVSTSAQLVKALTHTNIFDNIVLMLKTSIVPFIITCAIYAVLALCTHPSAGSIDITGLFSTRSIFIRLPLFPRWCLWCLRSPEWTCALRWAQVFSPHCRFACWCSIWIGWRLAVLWCSVFIVRTPKWRR